jgi:hypothetical protein
MDNLIDYNQFIQINIQCLFCYYFLISSLFTWEYAQRLEYRTALHRTPWV